MDLVAQPDDDRLTIEQAAALLKRSAVSIRTYLREGRLKSTRVLGRVFLSRQEILAVSELPDLPPRTASAPIPPAPGPAPARPSGRNLARARRRPRR